ncbi:hypothetical protein QMO56_05865 [Roseomonas sp. E05]|uniref:hypothetical protein n=1 Tax=Roseomonas sp. E05 TaxID=3046310 RepID=UPI0024B975C4|nr:hypothetical protein [Roseomonas sp. E05]MDJ0387632.1 hypothetical protein [Roseomonas sp. E05]
MTDMPGSRLWPLALMGWLAAIPPLPGEADAQPVAVQDEAERHDRCEHPQPGSRTAWLQAARARYAALSPEERDRLRQQRRGAAHRA